MICFNILLCLTVIWSIAAADVADFEKEGNVFVLTETNFDQWIEENPNTLVEFYAPWCGHCKSLAPEYDKAALVLKDFKVNIAKVDATIEKELQKRFDVSGFPTLKFWLNGEMQDYDGPRDAEGIITWVAEKTDPDYKPPPSAVLTLTEANFTQNAEVPDIVLVEFYAPWCGHCKQLAPEYEKAAKRLAQHDPPIPLAKVDATTEANLAKEYGVTGYPTLKLLRRGKRFEFNGPRTAAGIETYMIEQSKPASKLLQSTKEAQRFMQADDVTIIGHFDGTNAELMEAFTEAADEVREDFPALGYVTDADIAKSLKIPANDIALFTPDRFQSKHEAKIHLMKKPTAVREDIVGFFNKNCVPLVGHRTKANEGRRYVDRPLAVVYYSVDFSHAHRDGTQYWRQKVLNVAKDYKTKYTFAISDEKEYEKEIEEIGLGESGQEVNIAVFGTNGKRYPWDPEEDDFSEDALRDFVKAVDNGKVKPYLKSQPIPKQDKGPVVTVVGNNFNKIVLDKSKDVLIEFYAPWCGHCKSLEPKYKELAKKLKGEQDLVIAKMDSTANDVPSEDFKVEGFPTLYFKPAGTLEPVKFDAGREVADMEKYLKENAKAAFKKTEL